MPFPHLPPPQDRLHWSENVLQSFDMLQQEHERASALLRQDEADPVRMRIQASTIREKMIPLLKALENELPGEEWVVDAAEELLDTTFKLIAAVSAAEGTDGEQVIYAEPVVHVYTGRPGRPRKVFNNALLAEALGTHRKISVETLAGALHVHSNTLERHLRLHGIYQRFTDISDHDIDQLIRDFKKAHPKSGVRYAVGWLKKRFIRVPKRRVVASLKR
ncbi:hypothetical protein BKA70DRAFT_1085526, partial [Coprinopsis sp. MPI-PUGE-AT-0042]